MTARTTADDGIVRRSLVCIATSEYESPQYRPLDVVAEVEVIRTWLLDPSSGDPPFDDRSPPLNPSWADVRAVFRDADGAALFRHGDAVFVYITGHGFAGEGGHRLALSRTIPGVTGSAYATVDVLSALKDGGVDRAVVVVDTCQSGQTLSDLAQYTDLPSGWLVLFTSGKQATAGLGVFSAALARFLQEQRAAAAGPLGLAEEPHLRSWEVLTALNDALHAADQRLVTAGQLPLSSTRHPCLPNPGYDHRRKTTHVTVSPRSRDFAVRVDDLEAHWGPKARGTPAHEASDLFAQRRQLTTDLLSFVRGRPGLFVLTGRAGSGKSAVLSRLVILSDPILAAERADLLREIPEELRPAPGDVAAAVVATGKTVAQVVEQLLTALGAETGSTAEDLVDALERHADDAGSPATVVVDAVDESLQARALVAALSGLSAAEPHVRLLVGVRGHGRTTSASLGAAERIAAGWDSAQIVGCDEEPAWDDQDLAAYALRILRSTPESPYADTRSTADVARALAAQAGRSYLLVQIAARALAAEDHPRRPDDPAIANLVDDGLTGLLRDDLQRGFPDPVERAATLDLLTAAAYAVGRGVPWRGIWPRIASAVAARRPDPPTYGDSDTAMVLSGRMSGYLIRDEEDGEPLFRPFHEALSAALRRLSVTFADTGTGQAEQAGASDAATHRRIASALRPLVDVAGSDPTARAVPPYVRRHLPDHAALGGVVQEVLSDPALLAVLSPATAERLADSSDDPVLATLLHRIAESPAEDRVQRRAAELELWSRQADAAEMADAAGGFAAHHPWRTVWADWSTPPPHRSLSRWPHQQLLASWEDKDVQESLLLTGAGHDVRMLSATTGELLGSHAERYPQVAAASGVGDLIAVGNLSGEVALLDGDTFVQRARWQAHDANLTAVAFAQDHRGRLVLTAGQREVPHEGRQDAIRRGDLACWRVRGGDVPALLWRTPVYGTAIYSILVHGDVVALAGDALGEALKTWDLLRVVQLANGDAVASLPHNSRGIDQAARVPGHPSAVVIRRSGQGLFIGDLERLTPGELCSLEVEVASGAPLAVLPPVAGAGGPFITTADAISLHVYAITETANGVDFTGQAGVTLLAGVNRCKAITVAGRAALATSGYDGSIRRVDAGMLVREALKVQQKNDEPRLGMGLLAPGPGRETVVCLGRDDRIEVRETTGGRVQGRTAERFNATAIASAFVDGAARICVVGSNNHLYLLDDADLHISGTRELPEGFDASCLATLTGVQGDLLAIGSDDGRVGVWKVDSRVVSAVPPVRVASRGKRVNALRAKSGALLAACGDETVRLIEIGDHPGGTVPPPVITLCTHRDWARAVEVLEPGGNRVVVSAGDDGSLYVSAVAGMTAEVGGAHDGAAITALADLGEGYLASGGNDGTVRLWRVDGGQPRLLDSVWLDSAVRDLCVTDPVLVVSAGAGLLGLEVRFSPGHER